MMWVIIAGRRTLKQGSLIREGDSQVLTHSWPAGHDFTGSDFGSSETRQSNVYETRRGQKEENHNCGEEERILRIYFTGGFSRHVL